LDMRMNRMAGKTAADICNTYSEPVLTGVFREYGELRNARELSRAIVSARSLAPLETTNGLRQVVLPLAERGNESQYMARVFQALRIEVNDELASLKEFLQQCAEVIKPGGRLVVISYHSLEDRLVKNYLMQGRFEGEAEKDLYGNVEQLPFRQLTRKPIEPGSDEVARNPRARSAKMRIATKN
ncbi:MAG: 16S rRNA (cytosine(1402)-N(4))-methyltransferase RsmH, partial [Bacteroidota bacterium]